MAPIEADASNLHCAELPDSVGRFIPEAHRAACRVAEGK